MIPYHHQKKKKQHSSPPVPLPYHSNNPTTNTPAAKISLPTPLSRSTLPAAPAVGASVELAAAVVRAGSDEDDVVVWKLSVLGRLSVLGARVVEGFAVDSAETLAVAVVGSGTVKVMVVSGAVKVTVLVVDQEKVDDGVVVGLGERVVVDVDVVVNVDNAVGDG
ncbi:hypothetical protein NpNSSI1_00002817 [Neofusicoccum parvum]|nr:hypothetical protein NpNSSI1_00002817 [Neofusicoccum parvum]